MPLSAPPSLHFPPAAPSCDIFCAVVDNYGDIGISWRLARQLAQEQGFAVRLWVDDLGAFRTLCSTLDEKLPRQRLGEIEVCHWPANFSEVQPADLVIEAFGCALPESFVLAMSHRVPAPIWINLEYLSAEDWVAGCHALPSPHPRLPLVKYFFFPGFSADTGGLLREHDLLTRRQRFLADPAARRAFWESLGLPEPAAGTRRVSLFAYENGGIGSLLQTLASDDQPTLCLVPVSRALADVERFCGRTLQAGDAAEQGNLEIRVLPFLDHERYDQLLWCCDLNFVRGEDSFVRAQWAGGPFVWQIYAQEEEAHLTKLHAFLRRYCLGLEETAAEALRDFSLRWNTDQAGGGECTALLAALPALRGHAGEWAEDLSRRKDLATALAHFWRSKV